MTNWMVSLRRCETLIAMRTAKTVFSAAFGGVMVGSAASFCVCMKFRGGRCLFFGQSKIAASRNTVRAQFKYFKSRNKGSVSLVVSVSSGLWGRGGKHVGVSANRVSGRVGVFGRPLVDCFSTRTPTTTTEDDLSVSTRF